MATFQDNTGRKWKIAVNVQTVEDMQAIGFNVRELLNRQDELQRLYEDPFLIVDILAIVTQDEREQRGVSTNELFKTLGGPELDNASKAFIEALVYFFQNRQRALLVAMLAKMDATYAEAVTKLAKEIEKTDLTPMVDQMIAEAATGLTS